MQITQQMMVNQFLYNITNENTTMQNLEDELSTGKVLNLPQDNPLAVSQDMSARATLSSAQGYQNTLQSALTWMNNTSSALSQIVNTLQSIQSYVMEGLNSTNQTTSDKNALSETVQQLSKAIYQELDTQQGSRYLFGGADPLQPPVTTSTNNIGYTTSGNTAASMEMQISAGISITVNVSASQVMGTASGSTTNLESTLNSTISDLQNGNITGLQTDLTNLQTGITQVVNINAELGSRIKRATAMQTQISQYVTTVQNYKGDLEDANMAKVITQFNTDQGVFTAALKMGSEILLPSLVNYLPNG